MLAAKLALILIGTAVAVVLVRALVTAFLNWLR